MEMESIWTHKPKDKPQEHVEQLLMSPHEDRGRVESIVPTHPNKDTSTKPVVFH